MEAIVEGVEQEIAEKNKIVPDFEKNYSKIKDQIPKRFEPWDAESVVHNISTEWHGFKDEDFERVKRLDEAVKLPNVPKMELDIAKYRLDTVKKGTEEFLEGINKISGGEKLKWSKMRKISDAIEQLSRIDSGEIDQSAALLYAISETHVEGRNPEWIRQRIAQHAFDELVDTCAYGVLDSQKSKNILERSTQDSFEQEKDELVRALKDKQWSDEDLKQREVAYSGLQQMVINDKETGYEISYKIRGIWDEARGKEYTNISASDTLQTAEDFYKALYKSEGFNIPLGEGNKPKTWLKD